MAVQKLFSVFVYAVLFAATSFLCTSALDPAHPDEGSNGPRFLLETVEPGLTNTYFPSSSSTTVSAAQEERRRIEDFTLGTVSEPLNTPAPPAVGLAPGLFNLKPRDTPAPPAVGPAPGTQTNWEVKFDNPAASITINNIIDREVSAHCYSSQRDVPNRVLSPLAPFFTIHIQEDRNANIPWICEFSVLDGTETQSFPVWTHDGTPYLSECDNCFWKVQSDGFWIWSTTQQTYINLHSWNVNT